MSIRRIIIAVLAVAAAFYAASWLHGDENYVKTLAAQTAVRGELQDVRAALNKVSAASFALRYEGPDVYHETIVREVERFDGTVVDPASIYVLTVTVHETDGAIEALVVLVGENGELMRASRALPVSRWVSLLPPLLAIILAITLRRVLLSLGLAIFLGALLSHSAHPAKAAWYSLRHYLWGNFVGEFSMLILGFVFVLVGMVNVINRGGGMAGVVAQITKIARSARTACLSAACMGMAIFFDDYTNSIVVGSTMRSFTDRMRVSREKLAYIVDSTSAPLAGLAVISTWIGFEVLQLQGVVEFMGIDSSGYALFLKALPYRFYCIFTILFVFMVVLMRRDFGPMLSAERRAYHTGRLHEPDVEREVDPMIAATNPKPNIPERWYNAFIPVVTVIMVLVGSIIVRGARLMEAQGHLFTWSMASLRESFMRIGGDGDMLFVIMLTAAIAGFVMAAVLMTAQRILTVPEIAGAFLSGWRILPAALILIFAWSIRQVCDDLGTALFISSLVKDSVAPVALPLVIFGISAAVAFSTGTSFGTMGLMLPTVAPLAFTLGSPAIFVMALGAVLDGAIFGDHCSPISDTTVLSSLSSSCDLVDHVETQMPYAVLCMIVAAGIGYLPAAMGISPLPLYACGIAALFAVLLLIGRNPENPSNRPAP